MKSFARITRRLAALLFVAAAAGCASVSAPITGQAVSSGIKVQSGYEGCTGCDKVKTYTSPPVIDSAVNYSDEVAKGWINAKVSLVATNNTEKNVPRFQLLAEFVNNGDFAQEADLYIAGAILPSAGPRQKANCFSNLGSGCSWTQAYALDASTVEAALKNGTGLSLFIGKAVRQLVKSNNGYTPTSSYKDMIAGMRADITPEALAGFVAGLKERGAEVPTSSRESDERLAKKFEAADRMNAESARLERERPLKLKTGAQVCRKAGIFTQIGFVEAAANGKVKVRIADAVVPGTNARAGGFKEQTVWDDPDIWNLCGSN